MFVMTSTVQYIIQVAFIIQCLRNAYDFKRRVRTGQTSSGSASLLDIQPRHTVHINAGRTMLFNSNHQGAVSLGPPVHTFNDWE
jgi:hypothetical protein